MLVSGVILITVVHYFVNGDICSFDSTVHHSLEKGKRCPLSSWYNQPCINDR